MNNGILRRVEHAAALALDAREIRFCALFIFCVFVFLEYFSNDSYISYCMQLDESMCACVAELVVLHKKSS